jgi:hypothetical protein
MHQLRFNIVSFLLVSSFLLFTLVYSGSVSLYNASVLLYVVACSYILGGAFIPQRLKESFLPVTSMLLSMLAGALFFSLFIFLTVQASLLLAICGVSAVAVLLVKRKQVLIQRRFDAMSVVTFVASLLLMLLISNWEIFLEFSADQIGTLSFTDPYFFTAVAASIRGGSINNAVYELHTPVMYQDLGFFIPGMLAAVLKVSSHQALWGLAQPLYKLTVLLMGYEFCNYFLKDKATGNKYLLALVFLSLPLLLAPLHPLYVARLNVQNFIFSGIGHLLPTGTTTYPVCMTLVLVSIISFSQIDWQQAKADVSYKLFFSVVLALAIIAKTPMYIALLFFFFAVLLYRIVIGKEKVFNYCPYALLSLIMAAVLYKICFGYPALSKISFRYGYLTEFFGDLYHRSSQGVRNNAIMLGLILVTFLLWLGIRLVGLVGLLRAKNRTYSEFFIGSVFSLIGTTVFALFIRMVAIDAHGKLLRDVTFDVQQFIRSAFYIVTVVSAVGILYLIFSLSIKATRYVLIAGTFGWCSLAFAAIASRPLPEVKSDQWVCREPGSFEGG